ncbi:MAG: anti-sigma factor family protein [Actinomycetota bacterium]
MNSSITHERTSELLSDYVAGELSSEDRSLVDDHLAGCADCAAERDALVALAAPEVEPLSAGERGELRAAVLDATAGSVSSTPLADERDAVIVPIGGWRSKATKYVAVAAMLALLAVGFVYVGSIGTGGDDGDGAQGGSAETSQLDSGAGGGGDDANRSAPAAGESAGEALKDRKGETRSLSANYFLSSDAPVFESDQGDLSLGALDELSRRPVFRSFSETYTVRQARRSIGPSLAALSETVPNELTVVVNKCGRTALGDLADPGLAAYATTARVDGRDSFILGFVTGTRSLDRYRFVTFRLGDCRTIIRSLGGPIP